MTPRGRAVALLAAALASAVFAWLAWPRAAPLQLRAVPPAPASAPAGSRAEALDRVEAREAETYGPEEAARRRRAREKMLDLRAGEEARHAD